MRLGAVILVLATVGAVIFGIINFQQRMAFEVPDDGATWVGQDQGVQARYIEPNSPAERAGIKAGDQLVAINGVPVQRAGDVTKRLWTLGVWSQAHYTLERQGRAFTALVVVSPAAKPLTLENYLRVVGLVYLFVGLFIFARRWTASRAVHFYIFCLASFVLFAFHYTGKLNQFDWEIYWSKVVATLLAPALLVHFALFFPERGAAQRVWRRLGLVTAYLVPAALLVIHVNVATGLLGFAPSLPARIALDQLELAYLGLYFLLAAAIFLISYERAPNGVLRQQLKWVASGTLAGVAPFGLFYILPYALGVVPRPWMKLSAALAGAAPALFCLRHRSLPADGRGHHLQARTSLHGGDRGCGGGLRHDGRADRLAVSHGLAERVRRRGDRDRGGCVPVPAIPRMDAGAPGPLLLPRPAELQANADRVRPDADQRSPPGADAGVGDGPAFADIAGGSPGDFSGRRSRFRPVSAGSNDGLQRERAAGRTPGPQFSLSGARGFAARLSLLRIAAQRLARKPLRSGTRWNSWI